MRTGLLVKLACAAAFCVAASTAAAAQQSPAGGRLVLQTQHFEGAPPGYSAVPGHFWTMSRGAGPARPRAAADKIYSVDVRARQDGGRVEIKVALRVGPKHPDRLEDVATYYLAPGETVTASELEVDGITPFVFRVLRVSEADSAAPPVFNRTQSVAASVADFKPSPLPRAKLVMRNLSSKGVRAVEYREMIYGRVYTTGFAFEKDGELLMRPGASCERAVGALAGRATEAEFVPHGLEGVVVTTVVFDDYSYEGDVEAAAQYRSYDEGSRAQLPRLLALVREARAAADAAETPEAVRALASKLSALDDVAPQPSVEAVVGAYPELSPSKRDRVRSGVEVRMHRARRELLDDLERFEKSFGASPAENSFKAWLEAKQARYEAWLARL